MPDENLKLDSPQQHTLEKLELAIREAAAEKLSVRKALFLSVVLLSHGHPAVERLIHLLKHNAPETNDRLAASAIETSYHEIRKFFLFEDMERSMLERFYNPDGYLYLGKSKPSTKLLVVFTSIFNNFYFSNAILAALFAKLDCDLLFLKDSSFFSYLRGAKGIAEDFPGVCDKIVELGQRNNIERTFIAGFSAGGYAALQTSLRIPCSGYLGFSHAVNRNPETRFDPVRDPEVLKLFDPRWQLDLKQLLEKADPDVPRALYFGHQNERDAKHARHIEGLHTIATIGLPRIGHNTVRALFAMNMLLPAFKALVNQRTDWPLPNLPELPAGEHLLQSGA
jgi:pimeloyl-ACP methyl ester carboxylesterase